MIRRTTKVLIEMLALVSAGLAILLVMAAVQLSRGPLSVGFLAPYVANALHSQDSPFEVSLDDAVLSWGGWDRSLQLRAVGVRVTDPSGAVHADIPELTIGFSGRALLAGQLAPTSLAVVGPRLFLVRGEDGSINFADPPKSEDAASAPEDATTAPPPEGAAVDERPQVSADLVSNILADLLAPPGAANKLGYLTALAIIDADITLADRKLEMVWRAPSSTVRLFKQNNGLRIRADFGLEIGGEVAEFTLDGEYNTADETIGAELHLADIQPALFASTAPLFESLSGIQLPLSGVLRFRAGFHGGVELFALDVTGGEGTVGWPGEASAAVPVRSLRLRAGLTEDLTVGRIDELRLDLAGPTIEATGSLRGAAQGIVSGPFEAIADLTVRDLSVDDLKRLWPDTVLPNVQRWIAANLAAGMIDEGKFALKGAAGDSGIASFDITDMTGGFDFAAMTVSYFDTLPAVRNGRGKATLSKDRLRFAIAGGEVQDLQVASGQVDIIGLDGPDQSLAIEAVVRGAVRHVLTILDHPRLNYVKGMGIKPSDVGGDTAVRLSLGFPLIAALTFKEVEIAAAAALRDITLPKAAFDLDLTQGQFTLQLNGKGMDVVGKGALGPTPIDLVWTENFAPGGFARRFKVQATTDNAGRRSIGLDLDEYLRGPVIVDAVMTQFPNRANTLQIKADITPTLLDIAELGWRKEPGTAGRLEADLAFTGERPTEILAFNLDGQGFMAKGTALFAEDGKNLSMVKLSELRYGRTEVAADIARVGGGDLDILVRGRSFDAAHFLKSDSGGATPVSPASGEKAPLPADVEVTPLSVAMTLETMHLSDQGALANVSVRMQRDWKHWRVIRIDGQPVPDRFFSVDLAPDGNDRRLRVRSDDAGSVFKMFDISNNVVGGRLQLEGAYDDSRRDSPLAGKLEVASFRLVNAPAVAKLLSVALLTGVLDSLRGEGIGFDVLETSFTLRNDVLETRDAKAHGPALGLTAQGWISLARQRVGLRGTIVPAYAVNSILNNIPLIGPLLGGKGSGIFAATYRMTGNLEDPDIAVNPLAAVAPGFLRNLFRVFEGGVPAAPDAAPDPSIDVDLPPPDPAGSRE